MVQGKQLCRKQAGRVIGGVCAGLGDYFGVDPVLARLAFGILALVNGFGLMIYLIMWIVVPDEACCGQSGEAVVRANVADISQQARRLGEALRNSPQSTLIVGVLLIVLGGAFLLRNFAPEINPTFLLPVALITVGVLLLLTHTREQ